MRRFSRLTNGFSKKIENHAAAVALFMMYCNFARIHQSLRMTPAMAAGVVASPMEIGDIVRILEQWETGQRAKDQVEADSAYGEATGWNQP